MNYNEINYISGASKLATGTKLNNWVNKELVKLVDFNQFIYHRDN